ARSTPARARRRSSSAPAIASGWWTRCSRTSTCRARRCSRWWRRSPGGSASAPPTPRRCDSATASTATATPCSSRERAVRLRGGARRPERGAARPAHHGARGGGHPGVHAGRHPRGGEGRGPGAAPHARDDHPPRQRLSPGPAARGRGGAGAGSPWARTGLGLDGYAVGGLSVGEPPDETARVAAATVTLLPPERPRYLMGVGTPRDLLRFAAMGYDLFDCVLPTRNARNGTLFTRQGKLMIRNAAHA